MSTLISCSEHLGRGVETAVRMKSKAVHSCGRHTSLLTEGRIYEESGYFASKESGGKEGADREEVGAAATTTSTS